MPSWRHDCLSGMHLQRCYWIGMLGTQYDPSILQLTALAHLCDVAHNMVHRSKVDPDYNIKCTTHKLDYRRASRIRCFLCMWSHVAEHRSGETIILSQAPVHKRLRARYDPNTTHEYMSLSEIQTSSARGFLDNCSEEAQFRSHTLERTRLLMEKPRGLRRCREHAKQALEVAQSTAMTSCLPCAVRRGQHGKCDRDWELINPLGDPANSNGY